MFFRQAAFTAMLIFFPNTVVFAAEQVFHCIQDDGRSSFQRTRCAGEGESIVVDTVQGGWTSLRPGEKSLLKSYRERDARLKRRSRKPASKTKPAETTSCWSKRRRLDAVQAKLRRGYKPSQGEGLRRKRDDYTEYLKKFCSG